MDTKIIRLLILVLFVLTGCEVPDKAPIEDTPLERSAEAQLSKLSAGDVEIITIDGCEYIIYERAANANLGYGFMAHKGNCKNPIHSACQTSRPQ